MNINIELLKMLRKKTGLSITECNHALTKSNNNINEALKILNEKSNIFAEKIKEKDAPEGIIANYIHGRSKIGVLLELCCETDFVARRTEFAELAKNLAIQVASSSEIKYIASFNLAENLRQDLEFCQKHVLYCQTYFQDSSLTVEEYIKKNILLLGENIKIKRFVKFIMGKLPIFASLD